MGEVRGGEGEARVCLPSLYPRDGSSGARGWRGLGVPALPPCPRGDPLKPPCRHRVLECIPSTARVSGNTTGKQPEKAPVLTHLTTKRQYEQGDFR